MSEHVPRTSVDKAITLLLAFGEGHVVGVSELARRTGLPKSTAFRLLSALERNGAVERSGSSYRLGRAMLALGELEEATDHAVVCEVLTPFLAELFTSSHQTAHLAVLSGAEVVYLNKLFGYRRVRSPSRVGGRAPAYCTGVGKVLLAYAPEVAAQVLATPLVPWTTHTIVDPRVLETELETVRTEGVAYDREEILLGLSCVAAPVFAVDGTAVAALSVSGPSDGFDPKGHERLLREVAHTASRTLMGVQRRRAIRRG